MNCLPVLTLIFLAYSVCAQPAAPTVETIAIPGTEQTFRMALLPGGIFDMGSPETEAGRANHEGRHSVEVNSFWIGVHEVTFDEFFCFQFKEFDSDTAATPDFKADAVARPSPPYYDFTYGRGKADGFPATTMTQQAALRYCQWLSDKTGDFYRLPTEAEWEYACRAGTTTAYSWGDDASKAPEFAWFFDNSSGSYQKTGSKKPNPWGLYDMHGNVMEWCLDQYRKNAYQLWSGDALVNPITRPETRYARVVRGGSWYDPPEELRSSLRIPSESNWQVQDPQKPRSLWYLSDAMWLGFRVVRPLAVPSVDEMLFAWNNSFVDEVDVPPDLPK